MYAKGASGQRKSERERERRRITHLSIVHYCQYTNSRVKNVRVMISNEYFIRYSLSRSSRCFFLLLLINDVFYQQIDLSIRLINRKWNWFFSSEKLFFLSIIRRWRNKKEKTLEIFSWFIYPYEYIGNAVKFFFFSILFVLFLWRSQLFLIDKHKKNFSSLLFSSWLEYLKQNIWCVCVCACINRKLFHTHICCDRKKENDLCWSTHHRKKKTM